MIQIKFQEGITEKEEKVILDIITDFCGSDSFANDVFERGIGNKCKLVDLKIKKKQEGILHLEIDQTVKMEFGTGKIFDVTPFKNISGELEFDMMIPLGGL